MIEADPMLCKILKKKGTGQSLNVAISNEEMDSIDFYILSLSTRSSMDRKAVERATTLGVSIVDIIKILCTTIHKILDENSMIPDYLSINIEGMDFKVLRTIDFNRYPIKVIIAERKNERDDNEINMDKYLINDCGC